MIYYDSMPPTKELVGWHTITMILVSVKLIILHTVLIDF